MGRGRLHEITNQRDTIAPLTGFSATAFSPDDVPPLLTRAYAVFDSQRPRPVYIEVPLDVMATPASFAPHNRPAMPRPTPSAEAVAEAVDLIRGARRPAIIAGGGAQDDGPRLLGLAELLGAAVVLTTAAKGAVSEGSSAVRRIISGGAGDQSSSCRIGSGDRHRHGVGRDRHLARTAGVWRQADPYRYRQPYAVRRLSARRRVAWRCRVGARSTPRGIEFQRRSACGPDR